MQKTKLGISVGMLGAALYFLGLINVLGLLLVGGYVLLFESNEWLKKSAIKAIAIVIGFALLSIIISFGNDIISIINGILSWFGGTAYVSWPLNFNVIANGAIDALEKIVLVILGFKAFTQGDLKVSAIDKVIDKNM
ncbi:large-conductance mechanosensitive channel [Paenibacillus sp. DS2015]|uniref:hypothetical protein n=1 Tax=Paenibacillus sp. DS2015 TaxID=3373917 RepID=UPI003D24C78F